LTQASAASEPKQRDAAHIFLRRAARVAILVPLMTWFTSEVIKQPAAGLPSSFALFCILVFANLGGPPWERFRANAGIVVVGLVALVLGAVTGEAVWVAVPATFVAVFVISYAAVLRGYFAGAMKAIIVPWVLGATSGTGTTNLPAECVGWLIGGVLACAAASLLWPYYEQDKLKFKLADVIDASAERIEDRWGGRGYSSELLTKLDSSIASLQTIYDGVLNRPGGGAVRERALMLAVDEVNRLRTALWSDQQSPEEVRNFDSELARDTSTVLRQAAKSLRGSASPPSAARIDEARAAHQAQLETWAAATAGTDRASTVYPVVAASFDVRSVALTAELVVLDVRRALEGNTSSDGEANDPKITVDEKPLLDLRHRASVRDRLASQWSWSSPWFRTAIRTATALAATVLLVRLTKLDYALWVSLGAMAALKFDASGTRRTGSQVAYGTLGGFVVGAAMITLVGDRPGVYWVLLPIVVFLAAYTPERTSLAVGQGAFTVFLITLISISNPGSYKAGEMRVIDVALGVSVSLVISLFMWPHGAAAMVRRKIAEGTDAAGTFLVSAYQFLTDSDDAGEQNEEARKGSARAVRQAAETLDLAISQRGPGLQDAWEWMLANNTAAHLMYTADVVTSMKTANPLPPGCADSRLGLVEASERAKREVTGAVNRMARADDGRKESSRGPDDRVELWSATNVLLAHTTPSGTSELSAVVCNDTTELLSSVSVVPDEHERGRQVIALAIATGWVVRANQLSQRMDVLADVTK